MFPMLNDTELNKLAEDIKEHGLRQPIVLNHDESILVDGRNRLRACEIAGADFTTTTLPEDYDEKMIIDYIVSANLRRRDLTVGQKSMVATELEPIYAEAARKRMLAGKKDPTVNLPEGESREQAAKVAGVSGKSVSDAKALKREAPDLVEKVRNGEMTLNAATKERQARKEQPKPDVPQPKSEPVESDSTKDEKADDDWEEPPNIFASPELVPTVADIIALGKAVEAVRVALDRVLTNATNETPRPANATDDGDVPQWCVDFLESQAMAQNIQPMADVAATMTRISDAFEIDGVDWWGRPMD
jgi:ParB-like chromosome segregation protein Spo0J